MTGLLVADFLRPYIEIIKTRKDAFRKGEVIDSESKFAYVLNLLLSELMGG